MRLSVFRSLTVCLLTICAAHYSVQAATPNVVVTASPSSGAAPLAVFFDGSQSTGAVTYQWEFGDGGSSTSAQVSHIYNVAGTYTASLVVTDGMGNASTPGQIVIVVTGIGSGNVTPNMNYRIAPFVSNFKINRKVLNADTFLIRGAFNTVDLPPSLLNLAASIKINDLFVVNGIIGTENTFQNPANNTKPSFFVFVNIPDQQINISISKANLASALGLTGADDATVSKSVPIKISFTIGSQSYDFTQTYDYSSIKGVVSTGRYDLSKKLGDIDEGFFVVQKASAIEVPNTKSHFFEFDGFIARSSSLFLNLPTTGTPPPPTANWVFTLNQADKITVPIDRFHLNKNLITYNQPDRAAGGIHTVVIDIVKRSFAITTWDVKSNVNQGGTGLPVRGEAFTSFNFTLRLDLDQFDIPGQVQTLSVVTVTKLTRKTTDDAFWQTGRKKPSN